MKQATSLTYEFVSSIPGKLKEGTLYISLDYKTVVHKCFCGCGKEVVTPLSPTDWKLTYDGVSISLYPSIGNWGFECRSHYWVERNTVKWGDQWSDQQIAAGRAHDRWAKGRYLGDDESSQPDKVAAGHETDKGLLSWLKSWWANR